MEVRRVRPSEWRELRALRLRALEDDPEAFGRTLSEEASFADEQWQEIASGVVYAAVHDRDWAGMAGVYEVDSQTAGIWGMWVAPEHRRLGLGLALLDAVTGWSRDGGYRSARLDVTEVNVAARTLYREAGFEPTGHVRPLREGSELTVIELERSLDADRSP